MDITFGLFIKEKEITELFKQKILNQLQLGKGRNKCINVLMTTINFNQKKSIITRSENK